MLIHCSPMSVRAARRAANREQILAAAHELVAEAGYGGVTMAEVARRAGMATGATYRYFPSKASLFTEVFRAAAERELELIAGIAQRTGQRPGLRLATAVDAFSRRALAAPRLAYALMAEPVDPEVDAARLENKRAYRDVFAALLEEGVAAGEFHVLDAPVAAAAIVGALQEALIGPLSDVAGAAIVPALISFVLRSVGHNEEETHGHASLVAAARPDA
jgi:AcrR family transcriptional regulator